MSRIVVIGGGISGLSCARGIVDRVPGAEVQVLEASGRTGGCIHSERSAGVLWEGGPSGFLNRDPSTLALAARVRLEGEVVCGREQVRRRFILRGGVLRRFPDSPGSFLTSDLLSWRARMRVGLEPLLPRRAGGDEDVSVGAFARRRLGAEAASMLVDPVIGGIYAGDPDQLSLQASLPHLARLDAEGKSLIRAMMRARRQPPTEPHAVPPAIGRRRYVSFRGGIGQLVGALAESLGPRIRTNSPVVSVRRERSGWRVVTGGDDPIEVRADVVVSAAPAPAALGYLGALDPRLAQVCDSVGYSPVAMIALGFREADVPHPLDGFGYLVPKREPGDVLGVLWSTSIFGDHRASRGKVLLQGILGGARNPHVCDQDSGSLILHLRKQLAKAMGITAEPFRAWVRRHPLGIPQYPVGHARRVSRAEAALLHFPGLLLTGNAFRGVGINACTADAERVAESVAAYVGPIDRARHRPASQLSKETRP